MAQVERIKSEMERRVAEVEAVNAELENKLGNLNVNRPPYSDYETDAGSSVVGSPRRNCPLPLTIPSSPHLAAPCFSTQHSQDLTSDYLSDQDATLSSPQVSLAEINDRLIGIFSMVQLLKFYRNSKEYSFVK